MLWSSFRCVSPAVFLALAWAPCLAQDWAMYQHDPAHTSYSNVTFDPRGLELAWTSPLGYASPIIQGDAIYSFSCEDNDSTRRISCFDLRTGAVRWSTPVYGARFIGFAGDTLLTTSYRTSQIKCLEALDPATGAVRYTVPFGRSDDYPSAFVPYQDQAGQWNALATEDGGKFYSIRIGETSGSINWSASGAGQEAMPTIAGNSAIISVTGSAYAIDLNTGASRRFLNGAVSGGGSQGVAYDASRQQFYLSNYDGSGNQMLMAFHYTDNDNITPVWSHPLNQISNDVAIAPDGKIYIGDYRGTGTKTYTINEIDPVTGATLRSVQAGYACNGTPVLINGYLFEEGLSKNLVYDLSDFSLIKTIPSVPGTQDSVFRTFDAVGQGVFAAANMWFNGQGNNSTFSVYTPEPATLSLLALGGLAMLRWRKAA